jgi:predicted CoA-binding protein
MHPAEHHVVVLGASPKPARYSNQAIRLLLAEGYRVTPVHPHWQEIEGLPVLASTSQIRRPVQTLTLYVGPSQLEQMADELVRLAPDRVIFNPGTESRELQQRLDEAGIPWLEACTLVMLKTGTF